MLNKTCGDCGILLTDSNAEKRGGLRAGEFRSQCRNCRRASEKKAYWKDIEKSRKASNDYRAKNKDRLQKLQYAAKIKRVYGFSLTQYEQMREAQKNSCAICSEKFKKTPLIDHCHKTGKIRGLLCSGCNTSLGLMKDSPEFLRAAAAYLEKVQ